jgi:predicted unusual protein kinase regulating ubiquinone biosynthesis (AarF/ABC1/UbiB family)
MITIPDVILERTSKHVLTIYVPANKITNVATLDATGIERKTGHSSTPILSKILLRHIIFHTDHHPCKNIPGFVVSIITIIITVY